MTLAEGIVRARSHIVFLVALLSAFGIIVLVSGLHGPNMDSNDQVDTFLSLDENLPLAAHAPLRPDQLEWGRIAWRYFQNNIDGTTGLANSADKYPSTTMWDTASFLTGMISAQRIGLITKDEFDSRMSKALASLARLPLVDGALPNKAYDTRTLQMVDYNNHPTTTGIGWSALDIARVLVPLMVVVETIPEHRAEAIAVLQRWRLSRLTDRGRLIGATIDNGKLDLHQEGRLGYEEYAAKSMIRAGYDAYEAWRSDSKVLAVNVEGVPVPVDNRKVEIYGAQVYTTSEPYFLDGLEFGFDNRSRIYAQQVFLAQMARFDRTGILTAVSEGHLDRAPQFVYATVYGNGVPWAVLTDTGQREDGLRSLSTKTAFAWDALYGTSYTAKLMDNVVGLNNPTGGWLEGRYESSNLPNTPETANTNGIILTSLCYRVFGPILGHFGP